MDKHSTNIWGERRGRMSRLYLFILHKRPSVLNPLTNLAMAKFVMISKKSSSGVGNKGNTIWVIQNASRETL